MRHHISLRRAEVDREPASRGPCRGTSLQDMLRGMRKALLHLTILLSAVAPFGMAQPRKATPPKSPRLYIFDCGTINATDALNYRLQKEEVATPKMSMECFLIAHPKGNLM